MKSSKPKSEEQQTLQTIETSRRFLSRNLTSLSNHLRAVLYEYCIVSTVGVKGLTKAVLETLSEASLLPEYLRPVINQLWMTYLHLKKELDPLIKTKNKSDPSVTAL